MATLYIVAGEHGDEPEGLVLAQALRRVARVVLNGSRNVRYFGMLNPEGFARSRRVRDDNLDPNRVWGTDKETDLQRQIREEILSCDGPVCVIDAHSDHKAPHVLYAGSVTQGLAELMPIESRLDRDEGSLTAWCEDQGIEAITAEAQEGATVDVLLEALAEGLMAWVARNFEPPVE